MRGLVDAAGPRGEVEDEDEPAAAAEDEVSLRQWVDQPSRAVDLLQCLHIFRQIVDAVSAGHAQGVVVGGVRPSCFVMSSLDRVSFIESASCSDSSEDDDVASGRSSLGGVSSRLVASAEPSGVEDEKVTFPMKKVLQMEATWYTSPEEDVGKAATFASDVYRLGVLLFELFYSFESLEEKFISMANLRHRVLPPQLLLKWPKEASCCLWLLHPHPDTRPKVSGVLESEFLNKPKDSLEERDAAIKLKEEIEDQELLLEFLLHLQLKKKEIVDQLLNTIHFLTADIEEVTHQKSILSKKCLKLDKDDQSLKKKLDEPLLDSVKDEYSFNLDGRKRLRPDRQNSFQEKHYNVGAKDPRSEKFQQIQEKPSSKSSRFMKNFKKLEAVYFSTRCRTVKQESQPGDKLSHIINSGKGSSFRPHGSSVDDWNYDVENVGRNEWINPFLEGMCKYLAFSRLKVRADLKQGDLLNPRNLVCSMGFDRDKEYFATAGVNKKIKIFECNTILNGDRDIHYPVAEMINASKISCICWNSYIKSHIALSDFEGVVQAWDATRNQVFAEMREHEKRVWSVDFSLTDPTKLASGSDDGAVKIWNINQAGSVCTIRTKANVCSVQFQPDSAYSLAFGSADHKIYCYDLRNLRIPRCILVNHMKTVSYVKYLDSLSLVSASTDNSLKLWNLPASASGIIESPLQTFTGHTNIKNFVGLSTSDGYIATGSETNEVFVYYKTFPMPVLSYKFSVTDPISGKEMDDTSQFISSVCWQGQTSTLLAASSTGNIKLLEMV